MNLGAQGRTDVDGGKVKAVGRKDAKGGTMP